jgi:HlyD family secretion protein
MKKLVIAVIAIGAVAVSVGAYRNYRNSGREPEVLTAPVTRGDIIDSVGATGTLEAVTTVQVGTQVSGTISELHADFNSIVRKGQVIARLDPSLFETQIEQSRANLVRSQAEVERLRVSLEDAQTKLRRAEDLSARQLIPRSELETAQVNVKATAAQLRSAQAQMTQAQASLNQSQVNLEHTVITAPIDGIVIARNVDVGQTVAASMQAPTLFLLAADLTKMQVNANIDEADVGRIRPNQRVRFRVDAYPTDEFTGTVSQVRLQPVVVQNVVTYATVIDVPNAELKLKPGMTANVTIEVARRTDVVRIPAAALRFRPTPEIFAALGQEPPAEPQTGRGNVGAGMPPDQGAPGTQAPAAAARAESAPPAPAGAPTREQPSARRAATAETSRAPEARAATDAPAEGRPAWTGAPDPDRRRRMMERLESMPAEQREQFVARMRERGFAPPGTGGGDAAPQARTAMAASRQAAPTASGAQTIDSLFGPLPQTVTSGRVWMFVSGQLKPVRLRLGISDGTNTELLGDELEPGTELVTAVITANTTTTSGTGGGARNPLMGPQRGPGSFGGRQGGTRR